MAYLNAEEEKMLKFVSRFLAPMLEMKRDDPTFNAVKPVVKEFTEWVEKSSEYSENVRMKSAEHIKEMRKTNPQYCRESREKNLEYQKKSRAKKKEGEKV